MSTAITLLALLLASACTTTKSWTYEELGVSPPRTCRLTIVSDTGPTGCVMWYHH